MGEGLLRRTLHRLTADESDLAAEDLHAVCNSVGATQIADAPLRQKTRIAGVIRGVTLRPVGGVPALEADLFDGTGSVDVVWLGRRRIAGIDPGTQLVAEGRIGEQRGRLMMFNPAYTLLPRKGD
ncbi:MAG: OB-fold nucleic acid binding domain-containing protein [Actinomycetota bacterium]